MNARYRLLAILSVTTFYAAPAAASLELADKGGCTSCHAVDQRKMGPPFREVAKKYQGDAQAFTQLREKVRHGGRGVWGRAPMPPYGPDRVSDADLDAVLRWLLDLTKNPATQ